MINFFENWCEEIIVAVIISIIIESLLPNGSIRKYIKVVIGIYIIYTMMTPFLTEINLDMNLNNINIETIETSSSNIDDSKAIQEMYISGIKESMKKDIEEKFDYKIDNLDITYDEKYENINKILLKIKTNNISEIEQVKIGNNIEEDISSNNLYDNVRDYISENYKVPKENVIVN